VIETIEIKTPMDDELVMRLKSGDRVLISGDIYTARDAAHKRMVKAIEDKEPLPFDLKGQVIYYVGPAPAPPGWVVGSAGPTTSGRMDPYTPMLLKLGLKGMIGKGRRSPEVKKAMKKYKAVYFGAVGGAAALLAKSVVRVEKVAYEDLGPEAVMKFTVRNFPAIVVIDAYGNDLYETEPVRWACSKE
jgi:fumarate hydratase subunit beta